MARPQKKGIEYFPLDVGFFEDKTIKVLKGRYGTDGITVYLYILCAAYKENGYYVRADDDFKYIAADDLSMSGEKIGQIINFLCGRSLLDSKLFTSDKVLTSHGIQKRFQEAVKVRASKTTVEVERKYWVLDEKETQPFVKFAKNEGFSEKNPSYSEKNPCFSIEKPHKVKESKVKESRVEESSIAAVDENLKEIISVYENNIAPITTIVRDKIINWMQDIEPGVIRYAIEEAATHNARNWNYIEAILKNHFNAGRKTLDAVQGAAKPHDRQELNVYKDETGYDYDKIEDIMRQKYDKPE